MLERIVAFRDSPSAAIQVLSVLAGVAYFGLTPMSISRPKWRATTVLAVLVMVPLMLLNQQAVVLLVGSGSVTYGLRGAITGRIVVKGRSGPAREYVRGAAAALSAVHLLFGAGSLALALVAHR